MESKFYTGFMRRLSALLHYLWLQSVLSGEVLNEDQKFPFQGILEEMPYCMKWNAHLQTNLFEALVRSQGQEIDIHIKLKLNTEELMQVPCKAAFSSNQDGLMMQPSELHAKDTSGVMASHVRVYSQTNGAEQQTACECPAFASKIGKGAIAFAIKKIVMELLTEVKSSDVFLLETMEENQE